MAARETENNAYAFGVTNKEHYGKLWYFLEWSIGSMSKGVFERRTSTRSGIFSFLGSCFAHRCRVLIFAIFLAIRKNKFPQIKIPANIYSRVNIL